MAACSSALNTSAWDSIGRANNPQRKIIFGMGIDKPNETVSSAEAIGH
jgi:hypothetical protein